jgi:hypothetical protein
LLQNDEVIPNRDNSQLSWQQVLYVFIDYRIYLYALIAIGNLGVTKHFTIYFPLIVKDMGNSEGKVHLMTAPPYVLAFIFCLLVSYSSSQRNEHGFHLMFCLFVTLLCYLILVLINLGNASIYIGSCIACCGIFSSIPLLISWSSKNIGGYTKKSIGISFIIGIGQIGGILLPLVRLFIN